MSMSPRCPSNIRGIANRGGQMQVDSIDKTTGGEFPRTLEVPVKTKELIKEAVGTKPEN